MKRAYATQRNGQWSNGTRTHRQQGGYKIEFVKIDEKIRDRQKKYGIQDRIKEIDKKTRVRQKKYEIQDRIQEIDKK